MMGIYKRDSLLIWVSCLIAAAAVVALAAL